LNIKNGRNEYAGLRNDAAANASEYGTANASRRLDGTKKVEMVDMANSYLIIGRWSGILFLFDASCV
jgi:hypothetical protein